MTAADQEGIGWPVIDYACVDVDAMLIVPWPVCRVRSDAKVPVKACWWFALGSG